MPRKFDFISPGIELREIEFTNDEETEGTIDVYMSNVPACSYCENWIYNNNDEPNAFKNIIIQNIT